MAVDAVKVAQEWADAQATYEQAKYAADQAQRAIAEAASAMTAPERTLKEMVGANQRTKLFEVKQGVVLVRYESARSDSAPYQVVSLEPVIRPA